MVATLSRPEVHAQTLCTDCTAVGNTNWVLDPYQAQGSTSPTTALDTRITIGTTLNPTGYYTTINEGCQTPDIFTYQDNVFDGSEFIQFVLGVGITPSTASCFTIEWQPAGMAKVYDYYAVNIPEKYTVDFLNTGNVLDFIVKGAAGQLSNEEINITSASLELNGATLATITPSQVLSQSTGQPIGETDGPMYTTTRPSKI